MIFIQNSCVLCAAISPDNSLFCPGCWDDIQDRHKRCARCGRRTQTEDLCAACFSSAGPIDSTISLLSYRFPADRLLIALKYHQQLLLAQELGERLAAKVQDLSLPLPDCLVPVPLHYCRLLSRGYNQALEISRTIGARLDIPVKHREVKRTRNTQAQFNLDPHARRGNIKGAFWAKKGAYRGSVVIIDDIITTGSTANSLAGELRSAGASSVGLWACAHAC